MKKLKPKYVKNSDHLGYYNIRFINTDDVKKEFIIFSNK